MLRAARLGGMPEPAPAALRYLSVRDVEAAMPPLDERLALAERTMVALVADAELPAKIGGPPATRGLLRPRDAGPSPGPGSDGRRPISSE